MNDYLYKVKTLSEYRTQFEFCGAFVDLLYNKRLFKYNKDISEVIYRVYGIQFKQYVISSRGLMIGKLLKEIIGRKYSKEEVLLIQKIIFDSLNVDKKDMSIKSKRTSTTDIQLLIDGILNDNR
ncbi:hypothetical protein NYR79_07620 [Actinobacillus equuli subsp. haemolyticus]|uniref:hypothetical protein n=1 Tax=Actinobacillus equuli TaxID=718 RepID=UPI002440FA59|nr:hypothetical protein [Actinobacillus equuli]WGE70719.1 hypothetical protein NYR79_07620 [Actinobacillus equuli subsp. haemolyticus]